MEMIMAYFVTISLKTKVRKKGIKSQTKILNTIEFILLFNIHLQMINFLCAVEYGSSQTNIKYQYTENTSTKKLKINQEKRKKKEIIKIE